MKTQKKVIEILTKVNHSRMLSDFRHKYIMNDGVFRLPNFFSKFADGWLILMVHKYSNLLFFLEILTRR